MLLLFGEQGRYSADKKALSKKRLVAADAG
jgi:hypothetical protein